MDDTPPPYPEQEPPEKETGVSGNLPQWCLFAHTPPPEASVREGLLLHGGGGAEAEAAHFWQSPSSPLSRCLRRSCPKQQHQVALPPVWILKIKELERQNTPPMWSQRLHPLQMWGEPPAKSSERASWPWLPPEPPTN